MGLKKGMSANVNFIAFVSLLLGALIFHVSPAVQLAHITAPETVYTGKNLAECQLIREAKPWYGKINYWSWLWLAGTPLILFFLTPQDSKWKRLAGSLGAITLCYIGMHLSFSLNYDIKYGLFTVHEKIPHQKTWDMQLCLPYGTIAARTLFPYLSVLYTLMWAGLWLTVWDIYHRRKTRLLDKSFKYDFLSHTLIWASLFCTLLACVLIMGLFLFNL